ncbi:hypothetical protein [Rufibacter tibetensis]|uniref:STAS/SEC14 domain-containing protein n=1 Tax=Rufibacter tibetensis TaxID=512763 RepID=A0A0P0CNL6_9BACT|nr:hypothetical protein [Rufibacter tibetensis]ALI97756.1 hypothetical protein DC20_00570 [Rufibacter tibetensis]
MDKQYPFKDSPQLVFHKEYVSIHLLEAQSLLLLEWKRQISMEERKVGFQEALAFTHKNQISRWLVDDLQLYIITAEEKEWILTQFQEEASKSPLLKLAVVTADFYPSLVVNTEFTEKTKEGYEAKGVIQHEVFTDYASALHWLLPDREV